MGCKPKPDPDPYAAIFDAVPLDFVDPSLVLPFDEFFNMYVRPVYEACVKETLAQPMPSVYTKPESNPNPNSHAKDGTRD